MPTDAMPLRRHPAAPAPVSGAGPDLGFLYPLQRVKVRWHTLDGGEVAIPGQIQAVDGHLVAVWFDRSAPTFDPMHADDRAWLDVGQGQVVYVVAGRVTERRPPDTLVLGVVGHARRDQRRHYVREVVDLPAQPAVLLDGDGEAVGEPVAAWPLDLSGGGIRFRLAEPLPPGAAGVRLTLTLAGAPFEVVVRTVGTSATARGEHVVRGAFADLGEARRREIIQYVFGQQRRRARVAPRGGAA